MSAASATSSGDGPYVRKRLWVKSKDTLEGVSALNTAKGKSKGLDNSVTNAKTRTGKAKKYHPSTGSEGKSAKKRKWERGATIPAASGSGSAVRSRIATKSYVGNGKFQQKVKGKRRENVHTPDRLDAKTDQREKCEPPSKTSNDVDEVVTHRGRAVQDAYVSLCAVRKALNMLQVNQANVFANALVTAGRRLQSISGQEFQAVVADILVKLEVGRNTLIRWKASPTDTLLLDTILAFDQVYYRLFSAASLMGGNIAKTVKPPHVHFGQVAKVASPAQVSAFIQRAGPMGKKSARSLLELEEVDGEGTDKNNPLLTLLQNRWRESILRLHITGLVPTSLEFCSAAHNASLVQRESGRDITTMRGGDPIAGCRVRRWRDGVRVWAGNIYAYAVPNKAALKELGRHAPLVELGAGTGYWASLLRKNGAKVHAYDCDPPMVPSANVSGNLKDVALNEHHGYPHGWTDVDKGGPEVLPHHSDAALMLCCPRPGSPMAENALQVYGGDVVCLVGEWHGDTGTGVFERELSLNFFIEKVIDLPNWGDSLFQLTVWRRNDSATAAAETANNRNRTPIACWGCGKRDDSKVSRCRFTFSAPCCSLPCASKPKVQTRHKAELSLRFVVEPSEDGKDAKDTMPHFEDSHHYKKTCDTQQG